MIYSQEALEEMSKKVDLLDYASKTVDFVRQSGKTHFAVCPFHNEKTASLAVNTDENFFHCFGCGRSGNIYKWIQWTEHVSFDMAVQKVAELTSSDFRDYVESESLAFYKMLKRLNNPHKREISERNILNIDKDYKQKFADEVPKEWESEGILPEVMKKYEIRVDNTSNRIVYPVYDSEFQLIGVKGRTRFKNFKDLNIMKYMNYNRIGVLDYFTGMKQADSYIREKNEVIIFEGIKSVMKVDGWGYHNAVSAETSVLNEYQIELLVRMHVRDVVIAFDRDVGMKKIKECTNLLKRFTNVWVIYDKWKFLGEKDSPPDQGRAVWEDLYERKIKL